MIAIFIGVLELVKTKRILLVEDDMEVVNDNYGLNTVFTLNENYVPEEENKESEEISDGRKHVLLQIPSPGCYYRLCDLRL
jgi:hypothetical protein